MGKQRKIKTMRKFLNLTITLMILFISISTVGCGAKDDYIEGYGEDYIEEGEYEYYEEPQETTISDKDMQKILKKYPDWRTQPEEFARKAFYTGQIDTVDEGFANLIANIIMQTGSYNNIGVNYDPNSLILYLKNEWMEEKSKKDRAFLKIQKVKSIFQLEDYKNDNNPIYQYFMNSDNVSIEGAYKNIAFYYLTLAVNKSNGKTKTLWENFYNIPYNTIKYESQTTTKLVWTNKMFDDYKYCQEYFKQYISDYNREKLLESHYEQIEAAKRRYDDAIRYNLGVEKALDWSNESINGYSEHFYKFYNTSWTNLFNKNYDWSGDVFQDSINQYYALPNWDEISRPYKKEEVIHKEWLQVVDRNNNNASIFAQNIIKIFVDYAYNKKIPK